MFSSLLLLLTAALTLIVLGVRAADDGKAPHTHRWRRLKNLVDECAFTLGETNFDLCPVVNGNEGGWSVEYERKTPPTITKTSYRIDLKAPLKRDEKVNQYDQCPDGTWICGIISNRRPYHEDEEPRVLQTIPVAGAMDLTKFNITKYRPGVNITAELRDDPKTSVLHVRLHGGYYVYGQQTADFQFLCDRSVEEPSSPTYSWTWNQTHTFQWRTRHACGWAPPKPVPPKETVPPDDTDTAPDDEDSGTPPPAEEIPDGGLELIEYPTARRRARDMMILLLSSSTAVMALAYLVWRPPARVRHYVTRFVKAHPRLGRFRVGEHVLVRWAYEDLEMDEDLGEEDTMVNFSPAEEVDEGIPLKPSPRKGRWTSYGTA